MKRIRTLCECGFEQRMGSTRPGEIVFGLRKPTVAGWLKFVQRDLPVLECNGWEISFDSDFPFNAVDVDDQDWSIEFGELSNWWFELNLGIVVDGQRVSLLPILRDALNDSELMRRTEQAEGTRFFVRLPDGRTGSLSYQRVQPLVDVLLGLFSKGAIEEDGSAKLRLADVLALVELTHAGQAFRESETRERFMRLFAIAKGFEALEPSPAPVRLRTTLRDYQSKGLSWLQFLRQFQLGGILADEMGLGKTVQTIAHLLLEKEAGRCDGPSLIVCPTSVAPNWRAELERFAPDLKVVLFHGPNRAGQIDSIKHADVVITSYAVAHRDGKILRRTRWYALVFDEAQKVKNDETEVATTLRTFGAHHRICLTGTPVENHLGELWAQFDLLMPGYFGDKKSFKKIYRNPIEKYGDAARRAQLLSRIKPFVLRRTKDAVASELPPKTEIIRSIEIAGDQRDLYETVRLAMHRKVRREIEAKGLARSHIIFLVALLRLRQICCDPRLLKMEHAPIDLADGAPAQLAAKRRGSAPAEPATKIENSAKLAYLMEMLPALLEDGRKVFLFSQFTSMLNLIKAELHARKIQFVEIIGETIDRETPVARFQSGQVPLFLLSLKAGGTGLNLTAADTVIHYDPWWNPAVLDQATDRAHRIGQDKPVFVYHFVTSGTVEAIIPS